jgi:hypothetical protein
MLAKLNQAAEHGVLASHRRLTGLLFAWLRLNKGDAYPVRTWTDGALSDDALVLALAIAIPSQSWSHKMGFDAMGDRVAMLSVRPSFRDGNCASH